MLTHTKLLEIRHLDDVTTKDDIVQAISSQFKQLKLGENFIKSIRKAYALTQTAIWSISVWKASQLLDEGKMKVGRVVFGIRERSNLKKSFKCLEYGHVAKRCSDLEDRKECCIKCREKGHFAKSCSKEPFCISCKNAGRANTNHQIGSKRCPV